MYKCLCNNYYTDSDESYVFLDKVLEENTTKSFVSVCPWCDRKRVHGWEPDFCYDEAGGIMCFGRQYEVWDFHLPHYVGTRLLPTEEENTGYSTWNRTKKDTIHFIKEGR